MKKLNIKEIWKSSNEQKISQEVLTAGDIRNYRTKRLRKIKSSIRYSILLDTALKSLLLIPAVYLMLHHPGQPSILTLLLALAGTLFLLILYQTHLLLKVSKIRETDSIPENLKRKFDFYSKEYQGFLFTGSLSSPLFVMTGFLMYFHLKYDLMNLAEKFGDLILFTIIIFAWIITMVFQIPVYLFEIKELKAEILDLEDPHEQKINFTKAEKERNIRAIVFTALILAGIMILWIAYRLSI